MIEKNNVMFEYHNASYNVRKIESVKYDIKKEVYRIMENMP
jgi:hypothetical protein